jgi:EAL domain-containing protein (putative c-di-GMP-specific phosphodiesterase class I)
MALAPPSGKRHATHFSSEFPSRRLVEVLRCEALIRLVDQGTTVIAPSTSLPTAERFGLTPHIDLWVIEHAIRQLAALSPPRHAPRPWADSAA